MEVGGREFRLLLACARVNLSVDEVRAIRSQLTEEIDWTGFSRQAIDHGLVSLCGYTLSQVAADLVPEEILEALQMIVEQTRKRNQYLIDELGRLLNALAEAGVESIPFKGPVLALEVLGDLGLYESGDFDVLIRDKDLGPTIATLRGYGYERRGLMRPTQFDLIHWLQGQEIVFKQSSGAAVETCTRVAPATIAIDIDYDGLWQRALRKVFKGHSILTLAPEDELIVLAIDGSRDLWWNMRRACNIAAFIRSQPRLDWVLIGKRARAQGCFRMVLLAVSLARQYFGATVPETIVSLELTGPAVGSMVARIVSHWQTDDVAVAKAPLFWGRLRLHDGGMRQASYIVRSLFVPSPALVASALLFGILSFAEASIKFIRDLHALWRRRNYIPSSHRPLPDLNAVFATPDLFPMEIDEERNSISFIRVSHAWYRQNVTLNGRQDVRPGVEIFSAEVRRLILDLPAVDAGPPAHYVLHGAFCGSTLLARHFEQLPGCFVLKEPHLLGQLARMKVSLRNSILYPPQLWADWFKAAMALLTRAYPSAAAVIIKPTDLCNSMGDLFLDRDGRSKIIFLASPLREFLTSVLRPDRDRRSLMRNRVRRAKKQLEQIPFLSEAKEEKLSDGQCAAAIWLFNSYLCSSLLEREDADRILVLNSQALFSEPRETLFKAANFLNLTQNEANREALRNFSPSARHSKAKDELVPYSVAMRTSELADAERQILEEIEMAISWAKEMSSGWFSRGPFPVG
jgi:Uncharacterised nucleotidyltransferase